MAPAIYPSTSATYNSLVEIRDVLKKSRENRDAGLHYHQVQRIFEELKSEILTLVREEKSGKREFEKMPAVNLLKEIDDTVCFPLIWEYKQDFPFRSIKEEFEISDCIPEIPDAPFPQDTVDCAFITDDGYVNMTAVAINSIRRSRSPETKVRIHVVAAALSEYSEKLFKLFEEKDFSVDIVRVEKSVLEKLSSYHQYIKGGHCMATPAALLKFSLPELFPHLNRILYLDGDTLTLRDLRELFQTGFSNNYAVGVTDGWCVTGYSPEIKRLGKWLFNSGMMLLNLDLMRKDGMSEKLLDAKKKSTDFRLMDQPIFNALFAGKVKLIDYRYNFLPVWYYQKLSSGAFEDAKFPEKAFSMWGVPIRSAKDILESDITVAHFAGPLKPWNNPEIPYAKNWMDGVEEFNKKRMDEFIRGNWPPLVSVVVPIYNAENYLRRCLDSLCEQTLKEIEIICINDGSTDNSLSILKAYQAKDPRIVIINQENQGNGASRNLGIQKANGRYVGFVDADDYVDKDFFEKLLSVATKEKALIAKTQLKRVLDGHLSEPIDISRRNIPLFARFYYNFTSAIFDVRFLKENNIGFSNEYLIGEDLLFLLSLCLKTDSIAFAEGTFYYYVKNKNSVTHARGQKYFEDNLAYVEKGIDLLNERKIWDEAYYFWIRERFIQMTKVVLPQIDENPELKDFKPVFISRLRKLQQKVVNQEHLIETLKRETQIYSLLKKPASPLVSVIVPVYNTEKYLGECLDSICGQSLCEIEIICINDGSTDKSLDLLETYKAKDSRIRIVSQKNMGQGSARNRGLELARGKYVYFMDSDDVSPSHALETAYSQAEVLGVDVLLFEANATYETPELEALFPVYKTLYTRKGSYSSPTPGYNLARELRDNGSAFVQPCCFLCRRDFLREHKLTFPWGYIYEDNTFFFSILAFAKRAHVIHEPLFTRRVREGSTMTTPVRFKNFHGYAMVVNDLELLGKKSKNADFQKLLLGVVWWMKETLIRFYSQISPEEQIRARNLLQTELKNSAWLASVRKKISELHLGLPSTCNTHQSNRLPRFLVRLGAMFIWNKEARKRWREEHMDLTPKNGIDIHLHPELRRDSALKRFAVRTVSLFIFSKSKRRAFRAAHLNLNPKDGVDVHALSPEERKIRKQKKRERNPLNRLFNALIPASRSKIAHSEKRLTRHMEWQTQQILSAVKAAQAQTERRLAEIQNAQVQLKNQHDALERGFIRERELVQKALTNSLMDSANTLGNEIAAVLKRQKALETAAIEGYTRVGKCQPNSLEFRTFGDLAHCIRTQLHKIPSDADLVVGLPRSGMIPAYIIALFMNKKCCSLDEFLNGTSISHGSRPVSDIEPRKVLIVDDSCYSGRAMDLARERLKPIADKYEFVYTAVYGRTESLEKIDCCLEVVNGKRVWQWNYLNHAVAQTACFDMDGVLCVDPTPEENDDGPKYLNFIKTAAPLYIPSYKIRAIVTSRLEKYRAETEAWLRENGVQYDELVMLDLPTAEERRRQNCHATFKADAYKKRTETTLFVESEERQAKEIAFLTGKKVLCLATDELY